MVAAESLIHIKGGGQCGRLLFVGNNYLVSVMANMSRETTASRLRIQSKRLQKRVIAHSAADEPAHCSLQNAAQRYAEAKQRFAGLVPPQKHCQQHTCRAAQQGGCQQDGFRNPPAVNSGQMLVPDRQTEAQTTEAQQIIGHQDSRLMPCCRRRSVSSLPSSRQSSTAPPGVDCLPETATRTGQSTTPFLTPSCSTTPNSAS